MDHFCTLFDSFYLSRGLTLYRSLEKASPAFHLYIFAFDDRCLDILNRLVLPHATIVPLHDFEDGDLLAVKHGRTKAEYCWTCTPAIILYAIEKYDLPACTYLDADLFFYMDPALLLEEMGDKSILFTEHRYSRGADRKGKSGIYCVQFMTFRRRGQGMEALRWWRNACIEWCYDRYEDGKFGDQKYLDDWPERYEYVHVLQHPGGGLASWNVRQYAFLGREDDRITFRNRATGKEFPAVFYHFHHVRFFRNDLVDLGWRHPTMPVVHNLYAPYIRELGESEKIIRRADPGFQIPLTDLRLINSRGLRNKIKYVIKSFFRFNVFRVKKLTGEPYNP